MDFFCRFMAFYQFGKFSAILSSNTFLTLFSFFFSCNSSDMNVSSFVTVTQAPGMLLFPSSVISTWFFLKILFLY